MTSQCEGICERCQSPFEMNRWNNQRFCSTRCSGLAYTSKYVNRTEFPELSTGSIGALNELRVATDLLSRGYEVFRALSPSCSCDLIILKDEVLKRVECRTGIKSRVSGKISYSRKRLRADIVAVVVPNEGIHYFPPLEPK